MRIHVSERQKIPELNLDRPENFGEYVLAVQLISLNNENNNKNLEIALVYKEDNRKIPKDLKEKKGIILISPLKEKLFTLCRVLFKSDKNFKPSDNIDIAIDLRTTIKDEWTPFLPDKGFDQLITLKILKIEKAKLFITDYD